MWVQCQGPHWEVSKVADAAPAQPGSQPACPSPISVVSGSAGLCKCILSRRTARRCLGSPVTTRPLSTACGDSLVLLGNKGRPAPIQAHVLARQFLVFDRTYFSTLPRRLCQMQRKPKVAAPGQPNRQQFAKQTRSSSCVSLYISLTRPKFKPPKEN